MSRALVVREYEPLNGLREDEQRDLERFALAKSTDERSQRRAVFALRNGRLHAQNYVGIIETRRGTVIEILPKVDLTSDETPRRRTSRDPAADERRTAILMPWQARRKTLGVSSWQCCGIGAVSVKRSLTVPASERSAASTCSRHLSICS